MVRVVRCAFPDEPIAFHGAASHIEHVRAALGGNVDGIAWHDADVAPRRASTRERWRRDLALLHRVVRENARAGSGGHLLSLQTIPTVLLPAAALRISGLARRPILGVLHGYLNEALGWRSRNPLVRAIDMRSALDIAAPRVGLIALETGIADAVAASMPQVGARIATLRHPLPEVEPHDTAGAAPPVRIGFLGLATRAKGFDAFVAAARAAKALHGDAVEFHAVGRFPPGSEWNVGELQAFLATLPSAEPVPRERFDQALASWHYVCLPYRADHYTLSASGVLLDALAHGKPIIAGATPAVREVFAEGHPGVLVADLDRLAQAIDEVIATFSVERWEAEKAAMRRARERRTPERLAEDYRALVAKA
ncbi:glycosyltransferase [Piscinibacter koreensis]|uniref:Glycosyltransferase n=1 Tax=Piscinibacter koreensis TaxID=2742824 RepID=A0A7Y6TVQ2_9BURK|nr:glycosyltransferase [Schlegelella koreensis]NUZ05166.1 glycosyltransferase [Schlegelella koreensis]